MLRQRPRLVAFLALVVAFGVSLLAAQPPAMQKDVADLLRPMRQPPSDSPTLPPTAAHPFTLPTDPSTRRKLEAARDYLQSREWPQAIALLQGLLDRRSDSFIQVKTNNESESVWRSTRDEAERLLAGLPPEGMRFYHLAHDPPAQRMLDEALKDCNVRKLTEIVRRYRYTSAGAAALKTLGTHHLDRGRYDLAALCYQRLLQQPGIAKLPAITLFQACLAFQASADRGRLEEVWQTLEERINRDGLRLRDQKLDAAAVRREIELWNSSGGLAGDWPLYRGNLERTQAGVGERPLLQPLWQVSTTTTEAGRQWLTYATRTPPTYVGGSPRSVGGMPAGTPLSTGGKLIFRTHAGIQAVDNQSGRKLWHTHLPLSLESILANPARKVQLDRWLGMYTTLLPCSSQATLSTDGRLVFAIDDLPLPPHPTHIVEMQVGKKHAFSTLRDAIYHNRLVALDADTGAIAWEAGGRGRPVPAELIDAWFLGPPLPLGNFVYALVEQKQELSLVCLGSSHGELLWTLHLATSPTGLLLNVKRRLNATHLAYRDGLLICSTHAGAVVAVNVLSHSLVWAHQYPSLERIPSADGSEVFSLSMVEDSVKGCAPLIANGRVVVTSPDTDTIRCLQLSDGALLWTVALGEEDLYVGATHQDKVLVVGRNSCRALSQATGKTLWERNTPPPSGQGTLCLEPGGAAWYYLPLQSGDLFALNLERPTESTQLTHRSVGEAGGAKPRRSLGNLVLQGERLWSQTTTAVTAFPPLRQHLAKLNEQLQVLPRDPRLLQERARYRTDRGELTLAVADLHLACGLASGVALRQQLRQQFFDALTDLLQKDFPGAESYLDEYRSLCKVPAPDGATLEQRGQCRQEEQRRQTHRLILLAQGREAQGRLSEALGLYRALHDQAANSELLNFPDVAGVKQRADLWAQNRVEKLLRRAAGEVRNRLREQIEHDWRGTSTTAALQSYLSLFERCSSTNWPELLAARSALVERLAQTRDRRQALSALFHLLNVEQRAETPALRGQAVLAQARLLTNLGDPEAAAECYRRLRRSHAHDTLSGGRTGAEIFADVGSDKRLLPYLEASVPIWQGRRYRAIESVGYWPLRSGVCAEILPAFNGEERSLSAVQPEHRPAVSLRGLRFHVEASPGRLVAVSRATGAERWAVSLPINLRSSELMGTVGCCLIDYLAVIDLGTTLLAVDLLDRRLLWTRNLLDGPLPPGQMIMSGPDGSLALGTPQGQVLQRLGPLGPLGREGIYVQTRSGLQQLDVLTGQPRWLRTEIPRMPASFGDDNHLFLMTMQDQSPDVAFAAVRRIRAVRTLDGLAVAIPDTVALVNDRKRFLGRCLASSHLDQRQNVVVSFHDLLTGKEIWTKTFPPDAKVLDSLTPEVLAVAQPDGIVTLVDLAALRDGTPTRFPRQLIVDPKHVKGLRGGWLLCDHNQLYLTFTGTENSAGGLIDQAMAHVQGELTSIPIDGPLYAFDRVSGARRWFVLLPAQTILLDRFDELPLILCTAVVQRQKDPSMPAVQTFTTTSVEKRTGRFCHLRETATDTDPYHTLLVDPRTGTIDLLSSRQRLRFVLEPRKQ